MDTKINCHKTERCKHNVPLSCICNECEIIFLKKKLNEIQNERVYYKNELNKYKELYRTLDNLYQTEHDAYLKLSDNYKNLLTQYESILGEKQLNDDNSKGDLQKVLSKLIDFAENVVDITKTAKKFLEPNTNRCMLVKTEDGIYKNGKHIYGGCCYFYNGPTFGPCERDECPNNSSYISNKL